MNDDRIERIRIFKIECRDYLFNIARAEQLELSLKALMVRMENVHSPALEKIGQSPSRKELDRIAQIMTKTKMEEELELIHRRTGWVDSVIEAISSPAYQYTIKMTYINGHTINEFAVLYDVSIDHMYKVRRQFLERALTDEKMAELDEIIAKLEELELRKS
ncbi:MAG: hypothetical protein IJ153_01750 [Clostridia bacterium]|nr:hypothetical protein [Clostridia bacterium]